MWGQFTLYIILAVVGTIGFAGMGMTSKSEREKYMYSSLSMVSLVCAIVLLVMRLVQIAIM